MRNTALFLTAALLMAAPFPAAAKMSLTSKVLVVHVVKDANGQSKTVREEPKLVVPGDALHFEIQYANDAAGPAKDFVVVNPMPNGVEFVGNESAGADLSVDGGKTYGALSKLSVTGADGKPRAALTSDVTHIRWVFATDVAPNASGHVEFDGKVK